MTLTVLLICHGDVSFDAIKITRSATAVEESVELLSFTDYQLSLV